jgi:large subunit ribosomal protein L5
MSESTAPARLKVRYLEEIRPRLIDRFGYSSVMQAPKLEKVTLNMGVGDAKQDSKALKAAQDQLATIAGQQPSVRIRDFRGLYPRSFDGRGNYSMGVREQIIFPEIDYDSIDQVRGLDITITTTAATDREAFALLSAMGMPFSTYGRPAEFDQDAPVGSDAADQDTTDQEATD